jgi:hypothetical protein
VSALDPPSWWSAEAVFRPEFEGNYIAWVDLPDVLPGTYQVEVFFERYHSASLLRKVRLRMLHNHLRKIVLFRVKE